IAIHQRRSPTKHTKNTKDSVLLYPRDFRVCSCGCPAGLFCSVPERIKVEPVVRRQKRIMLQARDVALHPRLNLLGAMFPIQHDLVGEMFEVNVVAIPASVEAEEQNDGAMHHGSKQHRAGRQGCRRAEKLTSCGLVGTEYPVT